MMEWITVISLISIGILLIVAELIFIPGTTVVGIIGLLMAAFGVVLAYDYFDNTTGTIIMTITLTGSIAALVYALRNKTWKKFSLANTLEGKFNEGLTAALNIGDEGITRSSLRPMGKAEFNNKIFEVKTLGTYLESGTPVIITSITGNAIIVEPKN
ncbi:MAG TPA: NfeD family protein [Cyclobacteriaceae bacterium]|nr:NfeD family protein [Cyclobacteriaceae bacterium]